MWGDEGAKIKINLIKYILVAFLIKISGLYKLILKYNIKIELPWSYL